MTPQALVGLSRSRKKGAHDGDSFSSGGGYLVIVVGDTSTSGGDYLVIVVGDVGEAWLFVLNVFANSWWPRFSMYLISIWFIYTSDSLDLVL